jgi:hypothetical protein
MELELKQNRKYIKTKILGAEGKNLSNPVLNGAREWALNLERKGARSMNRLLSRWLKHPDRRNGE